MLKEVIFIQGTQAPYKGILSSSEVIHRNFFTKLNLFLHNLFTLLFSKAYM